MKKLLFLCSLFIVFRSEAQITGTYQIKGADTVKIWKTGGSTNPNATELVLQNSTDTVPGFLWNRGNGVTKFMRPLTKINSTTYLVGIDTLSTGTGGGGSPGGANTNIQINYGSSFVGVPSFIYDTTKKVFSTSGFLNTITTASNSIVVGQSNISTGAYSSAIGFGNVTGSYGYAFGVGNTVSGYSISVGNNNIGTTALSSTFGNNLINTYQNALVIGAFNDTTAWPNAANVSNVSLFPVFSIGNGANNSSRKNIFTILHNGGVILNLFNNSTLDSVLAVDLNGNVIQKKVITGGGGSGTLDSVGLIMPGGLTVSGSPVTGTGGHFTVTTALTGVVHASGGAFTGGLIVNADVNDVAWSKITTPPTTVTGYGITNAVRTDLTYSDPIWLTGLAWSKILTPPTTLAGYGITDPVVLTSGSYANPTWITQLAWSKITSPPTTIAGYGITDNLVNTVNGQHGIAIVKNADSIKSLPVDTSLRRNGYVLAFDSTLHKWYLAVNGSGGGATTFSGLSDVSVTSPLNNQIPVFVTGTGKWTNTSVTTSIIPEGSNLYWTNARFLTAFHTETTDSLAEGTSNLYFTQARARNSISIGGAPLTYVAGTGVLSIVNAKADGSTLGAATFTAADFNDNGSGLISIDYTNGQAATNSLPGFLSAADHTTFSTRTLTYAQNALNNTISINAGNTQTFLIGDHTHAGLLDSARATFIDSLKNRLLTFNIAAVSGLSVYGTTNDSFALGGNPLLQNTTIPTAGFTFSITGLPNKSTALSTDSVLIENLSGQLFKLPVPSGGGGSSLLTRQSITSGTSTTGTTGNLLVTFNFTSTISGYAFTMPAAPTDQQVVEFEGGGTLTTGTEITTLTLIANSGQNIISKTSLNTFDVGDYAKFKWNTSTSNWMRED